MKLESKESKVNRYETINILNTVETKEKKEKINMGSMIKRWIWDRIVRKWFWNEVKEVMKTQNQGEYIKNMLKKHA